MPAPPAAEDTSGVGGLAEQLAAGVRSVPGRAVRGTADQFARDQKRRNVSAINIFQLSVWPDPGNDDGRVLLTDVLLREEAIDGGHDLRERHTRGELRINHALQG